MSDSVKSLVAFCRENNRVCPLPQQWKELWEMLPKRTQLANGGWRPPLPLILAAWHDTSAMLKMLRLKGWNGFLTFLQD